MLTFHVIQSNHVSQWTNVHGDDIDIARLHIERTVQARAGDGGQNEFAVLGWRPNILRESVQVLLDNDQVSGPIIAVGVIHCCSFSFDF